jgi:hypothetical protein
MHPVYIVDGGIYSGVFLGPLVVIGNQWPKI